MRPRQIANAVAGTFLVGVAATVGFAVWEMTHLCDYKYDMDVLSRDLEAFSGPPDDASTTRIRLAPRAGDGSFPSAAYRDYVVAGKAASVELEVKSEAARLGWSEDEFTALAKGDRSLYIDVTQLDDARAEVSLSVSGDDSC